MSKEFGAYKVEHSLGWGPLGKAYVVREWLSQQILLLKEIRPELVQNRNALAAFKEEVGRARKIDFASTLQLHGIPEVNGRLVLIRAYEEGPSLDVLLSSWREASRLAPSPAVFFLVSDMLDAVEALHGVGPHGRLHPRNILLSPEGRVLLSDAMVGNDWLRYRLKNRWVTLGETEWLAPECSASSGFSVEADLFSLGKIFERLAGGVSLEAARILRDVASWCGKEEPGKRPSSCAELKEFFSQSGPRREEGEGRDGLVQLLKEASTAVPPAVIQEAPPIEAPSSIASLPTVNAERPVPAPGRPTMAMERAPRFDRTLEMSSAAPPRRESRKAWIVLLHVFFLAGILVGWFLPETLQWKRDGVGVRSFPSGAELVLLDRASGERVFQGITPLHVPELPAGVYALTLSKEGFIPYERTLEIKEGDDLPPMSVALEIQLRVKPSPSSARVSIRGGSIEEWSQVLDERVLLAGRYIVRAEAPGFEPWEKAIDLLEQGTEARPGGVLVLPIELRRRLLVECLPGDARVQAPGDGQGSVDAVFLPVGDSTLLVTHPQFERLFCALTVRPDGSVVSEDPAVEILDRDTALFRMSRSLTVKSSVPGAEVVVKTGGGRVVAEGKTLLRVDNMTAGESYVAQASLRGYFDAEIRFRPESTPEGTVQIELSKRPHPSVSLQARDAFSGKLVPEAHVTAEGPGGERVWRYPTQPGVSPGSYRIRVEAERYVASVEEASVGWEPELQTVNVILQPWPELTFRVEDEKGLRLPEARIFLAPSVKGVSNGVAGGDLVSLPPNRYTAQVSRWGYRTATVSFELSPSPETEVVTVLMERSEEARMELDVETGQFELEVFDQNGELLRPPEGASHLDGLAPGLYDLVVTDRRSQATQRVRVQVGDPDRWLRVTVDRYGVGLSWRRSY